MTTFPPGDAASKDDVSKSETEAETQPQQAQSLKCDE